MNPHTTTALVSVLLTSDLLSSQGRAGPQETQELGVYQDRPGPQDPPGPRPPPAPASPSRISVSVVH